MADIQLSKFVNSYYASNTFMLSLADADGVWLVDCGDYCQVKNELNGRKVIGALLTHTHVDHIYGLNDLLTDFPNVKIYTNDFGKQALSNPKLNMSYYHEDIPDFTINSSADIITLNDKDDIFIGLGCKAIAMSTQGHYKSCISYQIDKFLFSGDSYIPTARLVASFPNSNKKEALKSYERLAAMAGDYDLCPGHVPINKRKK